MRLYVFLDGSLVSTKKYKTGSYGYIITDEDYNTVYEFVHSVDSITHPNITSISMELYSFYYGMLHILKYDLNSNKSIAAIFYTDNQYIYQAFNKLCIIHAYKDLWSNIHALVEKFTKCSITLLLIKRNSMHLHALIDSKVRTEAQMHAALLLQNDKPK